MGVGQQLYLQGIVLPTRLRQLLQEEVVHAGQFVLAFHEEGLLEGPVIGLYLVVRGGGGRWGPVHAPFD